MHPKLYCLKLNGKTYFLMLASSLDILIAEKSYNNIV